MNNNYFVLYRTEFHNTFLNDYNNNHWIWYNNVIVGIHTHENTT